MLVPCHSQEVDWPRCGGDYPSTFGYNIEMGQLVDILPLRTNKRARTCFAIVFDAQGQAVRLLREIQFVRSESCVSEWLQSGSASGLGCGTKVIIVSLLVLNELCAAV